MRTWVPGVALALTPRRASQHDPAAHTVLANRALARCKLGRLGDAVADAKQAVTLAPSWSKGHARLGACACPLPAAAYGSLWLPRG